MNILKHLQFVQKNEKLFLWCAQVTNDGEVEQVAMPSFENFRCDLRNAPKRPRKTSFFFEWNNKAIYLFSLLTFKPGNRFIITVSLQNYPGSQSVYSGCCWEEMSVPTRTGWIHRYTSIPERHGLRYCVCRYASSLAKWPHPYLDLKRCLTQFPQVESKLAKGC